MKNTERHTPVDGELTPNGGDYAIAFFSNGKGPCNKEDATAMEIVEYEITEGDGDDIELLRTRGVIRDES